MSPDSQKSILQSAAKFFSGTMISRMTGMLRDVSMAYVFGTQSAVAALLVAFRFAHLLRRLLGEGAMQTAFIPYFEGLRKESTVRAGAFFCHLACHLSVFLFFLIIVMMCCLGGVLFFEGLSAGNAEIVWYTFLMMPSLLFICLFGINASLLQCEKSYFISSSAPVLFNLVWILGIVVTSQLVTSTAMTGLAIFVNLACMAQWAVTLPKMRSILLEFKVTTWKPSLTLSQDVKEIFKPLALGIIGVAASQVNNALDGVFARFADDEGPAFLWYAIRLQQLPLALFGIALSGALLPPLSRAIKSGDTQNASVFLNFAFTRTLAFMIPITAMLFLLGDRFIALIYGHGDFSIESIVGTTYSLWGYTLGLIPMALILILAPAFYAKGDYKTPTTASIVAVFLNLTLNTLFVGYWGMGTASIAFATSLSAFVNVIWLMVNLKQSILLLAKQTVMAIGLSSLAVIGVVMIDYLFWQDDSWLTILQGDVPSYRLPFLTECFRLCTDMSLFAIVICVYFIPSLNRRLA